MIKKICGLICVVLAIFSMGCTGGKMANNELPDKTTGESVGEKASEGNVGYELTTEGEYHKLAKSLSELVADTDLIVKIRVDNAKAFISSYGMIQTEITPTVLEVYKGTYMGQKLYVYGGEMLYEEYVNNEIIKKRMEGHELPEEEEKKLQGTLTRQSVDEQYIVQPGEEYIFFASKKDNNMYFSQYAYQGTYKVNGQKVENKALTEEPLKKDLIKIFEGKTIKKVGTNATKEGTSDTSINERAFVEEIKALVG